MDGGTDRQTKGFIELKIRDLKKGEESSGSNAQSIRIPKNPEISFCLPTYGFNSASCSERVRDL